MENHASRMPNKGQPELSTASKEGTLNWRTSKVRSSALVLSRLTSLLLYSHRPLECGLAIRFRWPMTYKQPFTSMVCDVPEAPKLSGSMMLSSKGFIVCRTMPVFTTMMSRSMKKTSPGRNGGPTAARNGFTPACRAGLPRLHKLSVRDAGLTRLPHLKVEGKGIRLITPSR